MKRIITCSDGTWNKPGTTDKGVVVKTDVEKMFNNICSVGKQHPLVKTKTLFMPIPKKISIF